MMNSGGPGRLRLVRPRPPRPSLHDPPDPGRPPREGGEHVAEGGARDAGEEVEQARARGLEVAGDAEEAGDVDEASGG